MNWQMVGQMVRLRYKLMWAKTRSRNGKIALFVAGWLLLTLVMMLFAAGGVGAAVLAIRGGRAEMVAQAVLGGLYVQALFGSVLLGFGMNAVFSEVELRRYPLRAAERRVTRHLIGIADPFWFLILALEGGLAVGLCWLGGCSPAMVAVAILLLFLSNYLLARAISVGIERLVGRRGGSALLMVLVMALAFLPGTVTPFLVKHPDRVSEVLRVLQWTPPFGAAAAMTHSAGSGLALIAAWIVALAVVLVYLENLPARGAVVRTGRLQWQGPLDRLGLLFGPGLGPLVGFWLRFYARNNRFRALYGLSVPLCVFLTYNFGKGLARHDPGGPADPGSLFLAALGAIFCVSFLGASRFAVNQFGYTGGAFRRFSLLPTEAASSLRAGNFAAMVTGVPTIPIALALWIAFGGRFDIRQCVMLLGSALTGLFTLHGAGLWASLYAPRKGSYTAAMGNDLSLAGNLVLIGGMLGGLFAPQVIERTVPAAVAVENWWIVIVPVACSVVFYVISMRATGTLFPGKREELLAVVEGRVN